jgi:Uma2 family endonuclease
MSTIARLLTAEDLWNMPDNGGRNELIDGELLPMSPINMRHMQISSRILFLIQSHLAGLGPNGGVAGQELGCQLSQQPDVVLAPDVLFIRPGRLPSGPLPEKFFSGAPDLAVEVISPHDSWQEIETKANKYIAAGTRLVWIVNPKTESVTIYKPGFTVTYLKSSDTISGEDVLSGFSCLVAEFFI